ncbi:MULTISPECIES: hypothetical protein [unclassified Zymobacter]|uniref:hypothetical protein n=1 Tax=unclassified Zymobacter TaxID=3048685 RepID=UPI0039C17382
MLNYTQYREKYGKLLNILVALDDNIVTDDQYELTKGWDINEKNGFDQYLKVIIIPYFVEYSLEKKEQIMGAIEFAINGDYDDLNKIFSELTFVFDYEIKDKREFLIRLKKGLENYKNTSFCKVNDS